MTIAMRVLVRRQRPHPGAQLDAFEERDGWRYQAIATNTRVGQLAFLEARHRAHARVEDRIRQAEDAGLGRLPSKLFAINAVWLELALTAADLLAWIQTILAHRRPRAGPSREQDDPTPAPAHRRPDHSFESQTSLRLQTGWPWALALARAFAALRRLPVADA